MLEACRKENPAIRDRVREHAPDLRPADSLPVDESHPLRPVDVNGINKMAGEWYHSLYGRVHGIRTTALRLTNTYGPRMRVKDARQTFLGIWIRQSSRASRSRSTATARSSAISLCRRAVEAFLRAAFRSGPPAGLQPRRRRAVSLRELASLVVEIAGGGEIRSCRFLRSGRRSTSATIMATTADPRGARLGPKVGLREGLCENDRILPTRTARGIGREDRDPASGPRAQLSRARRGADAAISGYVLLRGRYRSGEEVEAFERSLPRSIGARFAVASTRVTDAIAIALRAAGIGSGDEVVTVSHTA